MRFLLERSTRQVDQCDGLAPVLAPVLGPCWAMDLQQAPDDLLDACPPWLSLGPEADWLEACPRLSEPASAGHMEAAAETSDLSADTQERCLWTLAVVDSHTGKALRPVTPAEAQAVWVPQTTGLHSALSRGDSQPEPLTLEFKAEQVPSGEGSCPPSPRQASKGLESLERQTSVASQLSKIGGPCQHCGVKESPQWRRGPINKPILCNACGTRYRRTHQFKHACELGADGLPHSSSISSSQGTSPSLKPGSLESPGASLGTRSASEGTLGARGNSLGTRSASLASRSSAGGVYPHPPRRRQPRSASAARIPRKRALADISPGDDEEDDDAVLL